jgi:hypothetical protein
MVLLAVLSVIVVDRLRDSNARGVSPTPPFGLRSNEAFAGAPALAFASGG